MRQQFAPIGPCGIKTKRSMENAPSSKKICIYLIIWFLSHNRWKSFFHQTCLKEKTKELPSMVQSAMHHFGQLDHMVQSWRGPEKLYEKQEEQENSLMQRDTPSGTGHGNMFCK